MYTTLWPCPMCENAMLQACIPRVVTGADSFKWVREVRFNPSNMRRDGPIMNEECRSLFARWLHETGRHEVLLQERC